MSVEIVRNAPVRKEYACALEALKPILYNLPPIIVAIDGRVGTGKTTLGRFLAWRFNITLVETDLFMHRKNGEFVYKNGQVAEIIDYRLNKDRPVIVEGVVALRLLEEMNHEPKFHIHLICEESQGLSITEREWEKYNNQYNPSKKAQLILTLPPRS